MQRRTLLKAFALSASVAAMGLSFSVQAADTIKVGIMHSLSGENINQADVNAIIHHV